MSVAETMTRPATAVTELLRAAGDGDQAAWEQLIRRFEPVVAATVRRYRLQEADARDAAQRTWLSLLEHHRQLRDPEALGGWLATTAARECLRIRGGLDRLTVLAEAENLPDNGGDVEQRVLDGLVAKQARQLIGLLPTRSRTLLGALFADEPLPYTELAHRIGIPVGSIGPTRARALQQLRALLETLSSARVRPGDRG